MANSDYQVNYKINVDTSTAIAPLSQFTNALNTLNASLRPSSGNGVYSGLTELTKAYGKLLSGDSSGKQLTASTVKARLKNFTTFADDISRAIKQFDGINVSKTSMQAINSVATAMQKVSAIHVNDSALRSVQEFSKTFQSLRFAYNAFADVDGKASQKIVNAATAIQKAGTIMNNMGVSKNGLKNARRSIETLREYTKLTTEYMNSLVAGPLSKTSVNPMRSFAGTMNSMTRAIQSLGSDNLTKGFMKAVNIMRQFTSMGGTGGIVEVTIDTSTAEAHLNNLIVKATELRAILQSIVPPKIPNGGGGTGTNSSSKGFTPSNGGNAHTGGGSRRGGAKDADGSTKALGGFQVYGGGTVFHNVTRPGMRGGIDVYDVISNGNLHNRNGNAGGAATYQNIHTWSGAMPRKPLGFMTPQAMSQAMQAYRKSMRSWLKGGYGQFGSDILNQISNPNALAMANNLVAAQQRLNQWRMNNPWKAHGWGRDGGLIRIARQLPRASTIAVDPFGVPDALGQSFYKVPSRYEALEMMRNAVREGKAGPSVAPFQRSAFRSPYGKGPFYGYSNSLGNRTMLTNWDFGWQGQPSFRDSQRYFLGNREIGKFYGDGTTVTGYRLKDFEITKWLSKNGLRWQHAPIAGGAWSKDLWPIEAQREAAARLLQETDRIAQAHRAFNRQLSENYRRAVAEVNAMGGVIVGGKEIQGSQFAPHNNAAKDADGRDYLNGKTVEEMENEKAVRRATEERQRVMRALTRNRQMQAIRQAQEARRAMIADAANRLRRHHAQNNSTSRASNDGHANNQAKYDQLFAANSPETGFWKQRLQFVNAKNLHDNRRGGGRVRLRRGGYRSSFIPSNIGYKVLGPSMLDGGGLGIVSMLKGMGVMYGITGIGQLVSDAFNDYVTYDNIMQTTKNILHAHDNGLGFGGRFAQMARTVRNVGVETKFTAPEVADAAKFLAMAGYKLPDINQSIRPIADIALVGDTELGTTADLMTNIMTAYNIRPGQVRQAADIMTNTFTMSNTTLTELAEAYKYSAGLFAANGISFQESAAALGVLGNAGIKGSQAGTTMRTILANLRNQTDKQGKAWGNLYYMKDGKKVHISPKDSNNNLRSLVDIFGDLAKVDEYQRSQGGAGVDMYKIFHKTAAQGATALLAQVKTWNDIIANNFMSNGMVEQLADAKKKTISGLWSQLTSMFTENGIKAFGGIDGAIRNFLQKGVDALNPEKNPAITGIVNNGIGTITDLLNSAKDASADLFDIWKRFGGFATMFLEIQMRLMPILVALRAFRSLQNIGYGAISGARQMGTWFGGYGGLSTILMPYRMRTAYRSNRDNTIIGSTSWLSRKLIGIENSRIYNSIGLGSNNPHSFVNTLLGRDRRTPRFMIDHGRFSLTQVLGNRYDGIGATGVWGRNFSGGNSQKMAEKHLQMQQILENAKSHHIYDNSPYSRILKRWNDEGGYNYYGSRTSQLRLLSMRRNAIMPVTSGAGSTAGMALGGWYGSKIAEDMGAGTGGQIFGSVLGGAALGAVGSSLGSGLGAAVAAFPIVGWILAVIGIIAGLGAAWDKADQARDKFMAKHEEYKKAIYGETSLNGTDTASMMDKSLRILVNTQTDLNTKKEEYIKLLEKERGYTNGNGNSASLSEVSAWGAQQFQEIEDNWHWYNTRNTKRDSALGGKYEFTYDPQTTFRTVSNAEKGSFAELISIIGGDNVRFKNPFTGANVDSYGSGYDEVATLRAAYDLGYNSSDGVFSKQIQQIQRDLLNNPDLELARTSAMGIVKSIWDDADQASLGYNFKQYKEHNPEKNVGAALGLYSYVNRILNDQNDPFFKAVQTARALRTAIAGNNVGEIDWGSGAGKGISNSILNMLPAIGGTLGEGNPFDPSKLEEFGYSDGKFSTQKGYDDYKQYLSHIDALVAENIPFAMPWYNSLKSYYSSNGNPFFEAGNHIPGVDPQVQGQGIIQLTGKDNKNSDFVYVESLGRFVPKDWAEFSVVANQWNLKNEQTLDATKMFKPNDAWNQYHSSYHAPLMLQYQNGTEVPDDSTPFSGLYSWSAPMLPDTDQSAFSSSVPSTAKDVHYADNRVNVGNGGSVISIPVTINGTIVDPNEIANLAANRVREEILSLAEPMA